jgi:hypothetical protein
VSEFFRNIGKVVLWLVGGGIQGINWLWTTLFGAGLTVVLGFVVSYLREMPGPQFLLLMVCVFVLAVVVLNHVIARHFRKREAGISTNQQQITIHNYGQLNLNNITPARQVEDRQDSGPQLQPNELAKQCISDRTLRIVDLVGDGAHIEGRTFERCHIMGPALVTFIFPLKMSGGGFVTGGNIEAILWEQPPNKRVIGIIAVENCVFRDCTFEGIGIVGPPEDIQQFRNALAKPNKGSLPSD